MTKTTVLTELRASGTEYVMRRSSNQSQWRYKPAVWKTRASLSKMSGETKCTRRGTAPSEQQETVGKKEQQGTAFQMQLSNGHTEHTQQPPEQDKPKTPLTQTLKTNPQNS